MERQLLASADIKHNAFRYVRLRHLVFVDYLPVRPDGDPALSAAAVVVVDGAEEHAKLLVLPAQVEVRRTGLHTYESHAHIADYAVVVLAAVDMDGLVFKVGRHAEMVVLGIGREVFDEPGHLRSTGKEVPGLHRRLAFLPQGRLRESYLVFALDEHELELAGTAYIQFYASRDIILAHDLVGDLLPVGIDSHYGRLVVEGLGVVYASEHEHQGFILSVEPELREARLVRPLRGTYREPSVPVEPSGQVHGLPAARMPVGAVHVRLHRSQFVCKIARLRVGPHRGDGNQREYTQQSSHKHL